MSKRKGLVSKLVFGALLALGVARTVSRRARRTSLAGKVVLITGGSRGLGLAIARQLAERGARLALVARSAEELERTAAELRAGGAEVVTCVCDATDREQVEAAVTRTRAAFGAIDALVTAAATIRVGPLANMRDEDFAAAMDDTFWGTYHATMAVLPEMRARRAGSVVHIASIGGKVAVPHLAPYSTAKFAVVGFSRALRAELAGAGVRVTTIAPGLMRTGSHVNASFKGDARAEYAWFSLAATLPGLSISAENAARQIVDALEHGDGERTLSLPAKALAFLGALAPELTVSILGLQNRLLPGPGPDDAPRRGLDARQRPVGEERGDRIAAAHGQFASDADLR